MVAAVFMPAAFPGCGIAPLRRREDEPEPSLVVRRQGLSSRACAVWEVFAVYRRAKR